MRNKPNLLVDDENFLLIDHEQIFPFADNEASFYIKVLEKFWEGQLIYPYRHHLFYPLLKNLRTKDKIHLFDEFEEYLRKLRLNSFELVTSELENSHKFCSILLSSIS